jgi:hypothetical protein
VPFGMKWLGMFSELPQIEAKAKTAKRLHRRHIAPKDLCPISIQATAVTYPWNSLINSPEPEQGLCRLVVSNAAHSHLIRSAG